MLFHARDRHCERCGKKLKASAGYSIRIVGGAPKMADAEVEFKLCKKCFKGYAAFTDHWCTKEE